ncbi:MAG: hypothetical protein ACXW3F_16565 [Pyrinomonadaceae bacterium]
MALDDCRGNGIPDLFILEQLKQARGIRRNLSIAKALAQNLLLLEDGRWRDLESTVASLQQHSDAENERTEADRIAKDFLGIGPKQARNFLQMLGATRFEIPVDSRIVRWLNEHGFPIHLNAAALSDVDYYHFISDGVQILCQKASVLPCMLDASIFASMDKGGWTETALMWSVN